MAIPDDIMDKLEYKDSRSVQQEDIVRVMDENQKEKPWSRYMIQQHLEGETTRATVNSRLSELVELDVLVKYEYHSNSPLYDLAYDPIVTDGGRLQGANIVELVTLQDRDALDEFLIAGSLYSLAFLIIGTIVDTLGIPTTVVQSSNSFVSVAVMLMLFTILLLALLKFVDVVESWLLRGASILSRGN